VCVEENDGFAYLDGRGTYLLRARADLHLLGPSLCFSRKILAAAKGVEVIDDPASNLYPMPMTASNKADIEVRDTKHGRVFILPWVTSLSYLLPTNRSGESEKTRYLASMGWIYLCAVISYYAVLL
jgi:hypothetical protein